MVCAQNFQKTNNRSRDTSSYLALPLWLPCVFFLARCEDFSFTREAFLLLFFSFFSRPDSIGLGCRCRRRRAGDDLIAHITSSAQLSSGICALFSSFPSSHIFLFFRVILPSPFRFWKSKIFPAIAADRKPSSPTDRQTSGRVAGVRGYFKLRISSALAKLAGAAAAAAASKAGLGPIDLLSQAQTSHSVLARP